MKSSYQRALDTIYSLTDYEKQSGYPYSPDRFDLGRVERLLALVGNPQHAFQSVHIAGTKGKGSTSAMVASILRAAGYRTALYTSPHLHTFRERIQVNGQLIARDDVVSGIERLQAAVSQVPGITTFELITALAFAYFAEQKVEWAVIEVGMGGRLDATNVLMPQVSVITPISYDHTMYLGESLAEIAAEKAGIIKPGVPVVCAPQPQEAATVIARIAGERNAPLIAVDEEWSSRSLSVSPAGQRFMAWPKAQPARQAQYSLPLLGRHQQINATTALAVVDQLRRMGVQIADQDISTGLATVQWPGRLEVLGRHPWTIVDGAHNGDSMQKLSAAIAELFPHERMILILGTSADKDINAMLDAILPLADRVWVTQAHHPRAAAPEALLEHIANHGRQAQVVPIDRALETALGQAGADDLILATGSLFIVADIRMQWYKRQNQPCPDTDDE
jgi:dihydrofolate synthase/folylpolyglutamate synthase